MKSLDLLVFSFRAALSWVHATSVPHLPLVTIFLTMFGGVDDLTAGLKTAHVRPQAEQVDRGIRLSIRLFHVRLCSPCYTDRSDSLQAYQTALFLGETMWMASQPTTLDGLFVDLWPHGLSCFASSHDLQTLKFFASSLLDSSTSYFAEWVMLRSSVKNICPSSRNVGRTDWPSGLAARSG